MSEYEAQAQAFLDRFGIKFRATLKGYKCPPFCDGDKHVHGIRYRVTLWRSKQREPDVYTTEKGFCGHTDHPKRVSFDFWNSQADMKAGKNPTPYDVLSCISGDVNCPDDFAEFCAEYGYNVDSITDRKTWKRCLALAEKLQAFFSEEEIEELQEIR